MHRRSFLRAGAIGCGILLPCSGSAAAHRGFEDATARSGIRFRHAAAKTQEKYLPESMGAGVAIFDYDNAGLMDIFLLTPLRWRVAK